jgi:hypothetical protein
LVKGILAYCRRAFCAKMRNGCAKASFNPFLSTVILFFFHWKPARLDALVCPLGLFLRPSLLALRPAALEYRREWNKPIRCKNLDALDQVAGGGAIPRGPADSGRVPRGGEETAGILREVVLEDPSYCLGELEATYFYIINGVRGARMPGGFRERAFLGHESKKV